MFFSFSEKGCPAQAAFFSALLLSFCQKKTRKSYGHLKRSDGTTAAERFFESKPANMFEWLVEKMPLPARPRRKLRLAS
ncbi:DUF6399 domain-containing protein [Desulfobacter sp.]|uniref:DUF6399 domain-containing protein n=1 Tax=Desulfobacter sp. TaxID=2294 RepID=UPI003D14DDF5